MLNRRNLLKSATAAAVGAAATKAEGQAPPATFDEPTARFDPKRAGTEPPGAFTRELPMPPTLRPTAVAPREKLEGPKSGVHPFGPTDPLPIGDCFHGVAREWAETPAHWAVYGCDPGVANPIKSWMDKIKAFGTVPAHDPGATGKARVANWGGSEKLLIQGAGNPDEVKDVACFPVKCFKIHMEERAIPLPGMPHPTLFHTYSGALPGPTLRMRLGQPAIVRFQNHLETETSIHFHGGHNPSHADGFPTFYVLPGKSRDYFYPNILPLLDRKDVENPQSAGGVELPKTAAGYIPDIGEGQSTCWYHDHGMDCTAYNVAKGMAGFIMVFGEHELKLIAEKVLPGLGPDSCKDPELTGLGDASKLEDAENPGFYKRGAEPYHNPYDIPIVIQDKVFDPETGQIAYDSNGHNGYLGDTFLLNGRERPFLKVENRKYRFRFLDGSNSRIYRLRFLTEADYHARVHAAAANAEVEVEAEAEAPAAGGRGDYDETAAAFLRIGKDSWLWPRAQLMKSLVIAPANRADVVVDFKKLAKDLKPGERAVFHLVDTMPQNDGRGPKVALDDPGDPRVLPLPFDTVATPDGRVRAVKVAELDRPVGLMKIIVEGPPVEDDATIEDGTILNPHDPIEDHEVEAVREFVFERGRGAWLINGRFYDPTIANAAPTQGTAEEWVLRNGGGGWWHPIHIHLESHQLISYQKDFEADEIIDPQDPPAIPVLTNPVEVIDQMPEGDQVGLHDTQVLGPNTVARIRMRFRTWNGPFVFHCHNVEHEDMRMMFNFEAVPRPAPDEEPEPSRRQARIDRRRRGANAAPDARTHGNDVTWQPDEAVPRAGELEWEYPPVPATPARDAAEDLIRPRPREGGGAESQ